MAPTKRKYSTGPGRKLGSAASLIQSAWRAYSGSKARRSLPRLASRLLQKGRKFSETNLRKDGLRRGVVENEGTGGQCSWFRPKGGKYLPDAATLSSLPPEVRVFNQGYQKTSGAGVQSVWNTDALAYPTDVTSVSSPPDRVFLERAFADITIQNVKLSNVWVTLYDCVCRKDLGASGVQSPYTAWLNGVTDEALAGAITTVGSTPFQTDAFNQYFKVMQQTDIVLGAGATHCHKVRMYPRRQISGEYAKYTPYGFKDVTYFTLVVQRGAPANDTTNQTTVTLGTSALNVVESYEIEFKFLEKKNPTVVVTNNLPSSFANAEQVVVLGGTTISANALG